MFHVISLWMKEIASSNALWWWGLLFLILLTSMSKRTEKPTSLDTAVRRWISPTLLVETVYNQGASILLMSLHLLSLTSTVPLYHKHVLGMLDLIVKDEVICVLRWGYWLNKFWTIYTLEHLLLNDAKQIKLLKWHCLQRIFISLLLLHGVGVLFISAFSYSFT